MYKLILTHSLLICKGAREKSPINEIPEPLIGRLGKGNDSRR